MEIPVPTYVTRLRLYVLPLAAYFTGKSNIEETLTVIGLPPILIMPFP